MTMVLAICVTVTFAVSIYLMLGRELKAVAMGVFLLGHAAHMSMLAMSGSPVQQAPQAQAEAASAAVSETPVSETPVSAAPAPDADLAAFASQPMKQPPILAGKPPLDDPLTQIADPLPQALILTAIVIGFGVMAFLLTLLVVTSRKTHTIEISELAEEVVEP